MTNFQSPAFNEPIPSLEEIGRPIIADIPEGPDDLIPGLIPSKGQCVIAGETNIGKSLTALEICSSLVTGRPLWGELVPTTRLRRILYVLGEHYIEVIQRLHRVTRLPLTDQVFIIGPEQLGFDKWLVSQGKPNLLATNKFRKWAEKCDLVVFDPLSAFVAGSGEPENDNVTMRLVLDVMSLISKSADASCLVLAHQGKPMMDKFGQEHHRKSYAIRGASAIEDAATNIFYLGKDEGSAHTPGMILSMRCRKYKGQAPPEYRLLRDPVTLTHTLLGNRPYAEVLKIDTNSKIARLQEANSQLEYRTAVKLVAAMEGVSEETIRRRAGLKQDLPPELEIEIR